MSDCKTGADHIKSLKDGRTVFLDGKAVGDVTTHPAFRNAIHSAAALYDFQAHPDNLEFMTFQPNGSTVAQVLNTFCPRKFRPTVDPVFVEASALVT